MAIHYYEGRRIYFRPLELDDAPRLAGWFNDPDNWRTLGRCEPISKLKERAWLEQLYKTPDKVVLGVATRKDDRLIGCVGLSNISPINRSAEFGITIGDRRRQGIGLGTEATRLALRYGFDQRNLNRIQLCVFADHERAIRAYRSAGFVLEGRSRQSYFRDGRYHDCLHFAVLRDEWRGGIPDDTTDRAVPTSLTV